MDIAARVLAAIEETERIARAAGGGHWHRGDRPMDECRIEDDDGDFTIYDEGGHGVAHADHIVRHDPAAVLRRCTADRRSVKRHSNRWRITYGGEIGDSTNLVRHCEVCDYPMPCPDLLDRAEAYDVEIEEPPPAGGYPLASPVMQQPVTCTCGCRAIEAKYHAEDCPIRWNQHHPEVIQCTCAAAWMAPQRHTEDCPVRKRGTR